MQVFQNNKGVLTPIEKDFIGDFYDSKKSVDLFTKNNIYTKRELAARTEIYFEKYILKIQT